MNIYKTWMRLYQLGEFEAKKNQPKSKTLFGCQENNRKTLGRKRERERKRENLWGAKNLRLGQERCELRKTMGARAREPTLMF